MTLFFGIPPVLSVHPSRSSFSHADIVRVAIYLSIPRHKGFPRCVRCNQVTSQIYPSPPEWPNPINGSPRAIQDFSTLMQCGQVLEKDRAFPSRLVVLAIWLYTSLGSVPLTPLADGIGLRSFEIRKICHRSERVRLLNRTFTVFD